MLHAACMMPAQMVTGSEGQQDPDDVSLAACYSG